MDQISSKRVFSLFAARHHFGSLIIKNNGPVLFSPIRLALAGATVADRFSSVVYKTSSVSKQSIDLTVVGLDLIISITNLPKEEVIEIGILSDNPQLIMGDLKPLLGDIKLERIRQF